MKSFGENGFEMKVRNIGNETFIASIREHSNSTDSQIYKRNDDAAGALYYVCAVIVIYGFGIILMIASVINKGKHDKSIYKYIADLDNLKRMEKRKEKFKTRLLMQKMQKKKISFKSTHTAPQRATIMKDIDTHLWSKGSSALQTKKGKDEQSKRYRPLIPLKDSYPEHEIDEQCIIQMDENLEIEEEEEYNGATPSTLDSPRKQEHIHFDFV